MKKYLKLRLTYKNFPVQFSHGVLVIIISELHNKNKTVPHIQSYHLKLKVNKCLLARITEKTNRND